MHSELILIFRASLFNRKYMCNAGSKLKSGSHLPKNCVICLIETPLKMIKNAFYFILTGFWLGFFMDVKWFEIGGGGRG